jgi:glycosyltransferase involved in cell wall biosynthesis
MSNKEKALITVGLPVHNAMPYLPEAMDSLLAQTYSQFEILAIDDGSTDSSLEYLRSVCDPRLRVISQENRGLTATLNRMLAEVNSPWLARHDADDVAYPTRLAITAQHIQEHPDASMLYSLAEYHPAGSVGRFRSTQGGPEEIRKLVIAGYLPSICHPTVTLNVAKVVSVGGYRFDLHVEDIDLWWRLALKYDLRFLPEVLVGFRQNAQSVSSKNLTDQAVSVLYVQYLLLSELRGLVPLELEEIRPVLTRILDSGKLKFKVLMRSSNMALARGDKWKALSSAVRAFAASPSAFSQRVLDELGRQRMIFGGEPTSRFMTLEKELWPGQRVAASTEPLSLKAASRETNQVAASIRESL